MKPRSVQHGFTLVELMIALVISGIVVSSALAMGFSMMNSYRDHRTMVLTERAARASLDIISDALRQASPGVSKGGPSLAVPPELSGNIYDAVRCGGLTGFNVTNFTDRPDEIEIVSALGGVVTGLRSGFSTDDSVVQTFHTHPEDLVGGAAPPPFAIARDDFVVVANPEAAEAVVAQVEAVTMVGSDPNHWSLTLTRAPGDCDAAVDPALRPASFPVGALVIRAQIAHFFIDNRGGVPALMVDVGGKGNQLAGTRSRNPEPIALGIEDLQIAVGIDMDESSTITEDTANPTSDEWLFNDSGDPPPAFSFADRPAQAVRVTLVARSRSESSDRINQDTRPPVEDRAAGAPDVFRRRTLRTVVQIRNWKIRE
jgi:prepilin-type N-terminal cleavage/methylation domain-containing protein